MNSVNRDGGPSSPGPGPDDGHARHDLPEAVADRAASSACPQRCKKSDLTVFVLMLLFSVLAWGQKNLTVQKRQFCT